MNALFIALLRSILKPVPVARAVPRAYQSVKTPLGVVSDRGYGVPYVRNQLQDYK